MSLTKTREDKSCSHEDLRDSGNRRIIPGQNVVIQKETTHDGILHSEHNPFIGLNGIVVNDHFKHAPHNGSIAVFFGSDCIDQYFHHVEHTDWQDQELGAGIASYNRLPRSVCFFPWEISIINSNHSVTSSVFERFNRAPMAAEMTELLVSDAKTCQVKNCKSARELPANYVTVIFTPYVPPFDLRNVKVQPDQHSVQILYTCVDCYACWNGKDQRAPLEVHLLNGRGGFNGKMLQSSLT